MNELPDAFINTILQTFGEPGRIYLQQLPALIDEAAQRWHLLNIQPVENLSFNFVALAEKAENRERVVLKIGVPHRELASEIAALKLWNGSGCVRLIDSDADRGFLLEQRLCPGRLLSSISDDDQSTLIAADVIKKLWVPAPSELPLIMLKSWFDELKAIRIRYNGGSGKFPLRLLETAESLIPDLFSENVSPVVMHGDFHHYNILSHGGDWLVIDPKGVIGPCEYEIAPFMLNPIFEMRPNFKQQTERRLDLFAERLGLDRQRLLAWSLAHSVLSAWWDVDEKTDRGGELAIACGEIFLSMI